jgi:hypothetical protein
MFIVPFSMRRISMPVAYWESVPGQKFHFLQEKEAQHFLKLSPCRPIRCNGGSSLNRLPIFYLSTEAKAPQTIVGCSSLTSQDPQVGSAMYHSLQRHLAAPEFRTTPLPHCDMPLLQSESTNAKVQPPKLFRA